MSDWKFDGGTEGVEAQETSLATFLHKGDVGVHILTFHTIHEKDGMLEIIQVTEPMPDLVHNPDYNHCRKFSKRIFDNDMAKARLVKQLALIGDYSGKRAEVDNAFKQSNPISTLHKVLKDIKLAYILQVKEFIGKDGVVRGYLDWASWEFNGAFCRPVERIDELKALAEKYSESLYIKVQRPSTSSPNVSMDGELPGEDEELT